MRCAILLCLFVLFISSQAHLLFAKSEAIEEDFLLTLFQTSNHSQKLTTRQSPPYQALTPNGPLLHPSWDPDHCDEKIRIQSAFLGTLELAKNALESLRVNGADDVFQRYFQASSRSQVFKIFRAFLNLQPGSPAGPANALFLNAMLGYGDAPPQWSPENQGTCENRGDYAYMVNFQASVVPQLVNIGFLAVCPKAFIRLPKELDLPLMTAATKDTTSCDEIMAKGYAWEQMRGLSGLLLHELLHYNFLIASSGADLGTVINAQENVYLGDFNGAGTVQGCDPPTGQYTQASQNMDAPLTYWAGYGVWNSQRLRLVDGGDPTITLRNVENYVWFAHEAYFQKLCNLDAKLGPAIREEGTQFNFAQMPQPPAIPGQGAPAACLLPVNWNVGPGDEPDDGFVPQRAKG